MAESAPVLVPARGGAKPALDAARIYGFALWKMLLTGTLVSLLGGGAFIIIQSGRHDLKQIVIILALFVIIGWLGALVNFAVLNTVLRRLLTGLAAEMEQSCGLTAAIEHEHHLKQALRNFQAVYRKVLGAFRDKTTIVKRVATVAKVALAESAEEIEHLQATAGELRRLNERIAALRRHWGESRRKVTELVLPAEQVLRAAAPAGELKGMRESVQSALGLAEKLRPMVEQFSRAAAELRAESYQWQRLPELLAELNGKLNEATMTLAVAAGATPEKLLAHAESLRESADEMLKQSALATQGGEKYATSLQAMERIITESRELIFRSANDFEEVVRAMDGTVQFVDAQRAQLAAILAALRDPTAQMEVSELLLQTITALEGNERAGMDLVQRMEEEVKKLAHIREITEEIKPIIEELNEIMFDFGGGKPAA